MSFRILVLGGYGNFGSKICRKLVGVDGIKLIVAGRSQQKANAFASELTAESGIGVIGCAIDCTDADLASKLQETRANLVIHTSGPFQNQDYHVAKSCIEAGMHYLDLADGRDYVANFGTSEFSELDKRAKEQGVLCLSGASTVPSLSSAVLHEFLPNFEMVETLDYGISLANKTDKGQATIAAILSYIGQPFQRWENSQWQNAHGWQAAHQKTFPEPMGKRWQASCDVPDLALYPEHFPQIKTMRFYAGLELSVSHLGLWLASWLVRIGLVNNAWLVKLSGVFARLNSYLKPFGSSNGGMYVRLQGTDLSGNAKALTWYLLAESGHGPHIPTIPAVILAKKLAKGELNQTGAMPCLSMFSLDEFMVEIDGLHIQQVLEHE